ncbi:hypothetical protein MBANPS3_000070 [Mucor bainieri]
MATLDAFLIRGKKKAASSSLQDTHIQPAFVNPFTAQVKKPSSLLLGNKASVIETPARHQNKRNTIAHYFAPATKEAVDADVDMEEATDVCVIRNKIPVMSLWDMIQYELDQDPFYNDITEESSAATTTTTALAIANNNYTKRRRSRQSDAEQTSKRLRKTDHELSNIMTRFLNMGSMIKPQPMLISSLDLLNEFTEDVEDLSRHEFLDFAINE